MKKAVLIVGIAAVVIVIAGVALWNYHEQPQFCATCHIMQPYLESWESPSLLAHAHAEENITCLERHEPTIQQQVQEVGEFATKDYKAPLIAKVPEGMFLGSFSRDDHRFCLVRLYLYGMMPPEER